MSQVQELIKKYNAVECLGKLMVRVNGRNEWMATYDSNGFQFTDIGAKLEEGFLKVDAAYAAPAEAAAEEPKKARKKKEVEPEQGDLFAGLDAE